MCHLVSFFQAVKDGLGRVFLTRLPIKLGPDALVKLILDKCDVKKSEHGGSPTVPVTGTGTTRFRSQIESGLNVQ